MINMYRFSRKLLFLLQGINLVIADVYRRVDFCFRPFVIVELKASLCALFVFVEKVLINMMTIDIMGY